jgi:integrase/recombinase XerD
LKLLDYLLPNMASNFSLSKFSSRIALELQGKSLATVLAILFQRRERRREERPMHVGAGTTLYDPTYGRKYLTAAERRRFTRAVRTVELQVRLFCLTLMWSGGRLSETLAITPRAIDLDAGAVAIETLKRRARGVTRHVPLPRSLLHELDRVFGLRAAQRDPARAARRLWPWSRTTAWRRVKEVMALAAIHGTAAMPKGLRHTFGVNAFHNDVPAHLVQRWLGHASLRTTAIYGEVMGREERSFANRMWGRSQC